MKKKIKISILALLTIVAFTACEKTDLDSIESIEGTYIGTLSSGSDLKNSSIITHGGTDATVEISQTDDGEILAHCYGGEIDTTFMLNYFPHNDSILVCLTGTDFALMYDHMLGAGHMSGGMMGHYQNDGTEWEHHMSDEHDEGDEHFGGFDMLNHSFGYTFKWNGVDYHFEGTKK